MFHNFAVIECVVNLQTGRNTFSYITVHCCCSRGLLNTTRKGKPWYSVCIKNLNISNGFRMIMRHTSITFV